jgi:shikimate kinase
MISGPISDHLALVGLMGSGKSSVGRLLAARMGRELVDTDHLVEQVTGRSIAELFTNEGERSFRRYELESLRRALRRTEPVVVATGGGVVLTADARRALEVDATVVWLRGTPELLARRIDGDRARPLLGRRDTAAVLRALHDQREDLYVEVADAIVDVDEHGPEEVAEQVLDVLGWES